MNGTGEPFYVSPDGEIRLYGRRWNLVRRSILDRLRCRAGRHRAAQWGGSARQSQERCACGASRRDSADAWFGGNLSDRERGRRKFSADWAVLGSDFYDGLQTRPPSGY